MKSFLFFLFLISINVSAERTPKLYKDCEVFFNATLNGSIASIPDKQIKISRLNFYRNMVWNSWAKANQSEKNGLGTKLDSLSKNTSQSWTLPFDLEPNAKLPFYFGYKGNKPTNGYPLFIYLHGSGPKDSEWDTGYQLAHIFEDSPSVYFIPQIPNEGPWYRWWQKSKQFAWSKLLRQVLLRKDIDPNRLYVFGISEGGYGSQRLASFYADYWAAAGPMAGGEPLKNAPAENLSNTGFSLLTGAEDYGFYRNRLTRYTQEALDSLQDLNPSLYHHNIKLIPGKGHHIDYRPTTPWLSRFTRNPWPKHFIWEDFEMDGIHRTGFYNILVKERPCNKLRTRYDVDITDNTVRIFVNNVKYHTIETDSIYGIEMKFHKTYDQAKSGKFTIFFNEHLVNLKKPVKIIVNNKTVFENTIPLNIKYLLLSTTTFCDPERIFPGAVDIEF